MQCLIDNKTDLNRFVIDEVLSACTQRSGIAAGVEFIECPARNCCPLKI